MADHQLVHASHARQVSNLTMLHDAAYAALEQEKVNRCRRGITGLEIARLCGVTLQAMEAYAAAVEGLSWPVPRRVLQEIRLHQLLLGVRRSAARS